VLLPTGIRAVPGSHRSTTPHARGVVPAQNPGMAVPGGCSCCNFSRGTPHWLQGPAALGAAFFAQVRGFAFGALITGLLLGTGRTVARRPQWDRM
jgi:hypothetical protein